MKRELLSRITIIEKKIQPDILKSFFLESVWFSKTTDTSLKSTQSQSELLERAEDKTERGSDKKTFSHLQCLIWHGSQDQMWI